MKRHPLQPLNEWEEDMWSVWDRIKAALDRQAYIRTQAGLDVWTARARPLWNFITECDAIVRRASPDRCSIAYGYWLTVRGIKAWTPPTGGPFIWTPPGRGRVGEAELLAQKEAKRQSVKDEIKTMQKAHLKAHRADVRAARKAARKEQRDGVVCTAGR